MFNSISRETDNATVRLKQINTLKIFNEKVTEVVKDEEYKIDFETGGRTVSLIVKLGPDFPLEKPSLFIHPLVRHHWVSQTGEIIFAPGLLNYSALSDLGRVVNAIIREFELRPPQLLNGDISPPQSQTLNFTSQQPYFVYSDKNYNIPEASGYSNSFPFLNDLSTGRLKELNENNDLLNKYLETLNLNSRITGQMDELVDKNEAMALDNLKREPELIQLQEDVTSLCSNYKELKNKYEELSLEYKDCCDKFNPHKIIERIRQSVAEVDEESEKIAESFLTGDLDLETFLFEYINHRTISHSRKVKDEKLSQQLEKLHKAGF